MNIDGGIAHMSKWRHECYDSYDISVIGIPPLFTPGTLVMHLSIQGTCFPSTGVPLDRGIATAPDREST